MNAIGKILRGNQTFMMPGFSLIARWPPFRLILGVCLFETAFYVAYRYAMTFSHECASPFWFPDSVLLCALLLSRPGRWWIFLLAPLPIRLLVAAPPEVPSWFLLTTFAIDSAKGLLTAVVLRRLITNPRRLETVREFATYCLFAVLLVPAISAFGGAAARQALGHAYWVAWEQWFMGNALANLIITPAILCWISGATQARLPSGKKLLEGGLLALGLVLTGYYMAFDTESLRRGLADTRYYAPVPFLFWAAIRFGMFGASGAITILAMFAVEAALDGRGIFAGQSPAGMALELQNFLLLRAAPLYLVAILIEQNQGGERSLRESEARFRHMADAAPVMIWMSGPDKRCIYFNQRWLDFTGRPEALEMGDGWMTNVHPEDVGLRVTGYQKAFDSHEPFAVEYRLRRHDGQYRWILAQAAPRLTASGEFLGYIGSCLDITDRKHSEAETQRQRMELAHMARVSIMGQLASTLAHELNQPLGAILRNAEAGELILQQSPPDLEEIRAILSDIRQDDQRAGAVIDRMRSLLKRRYLELEPLSMKQLLDQVAALMRAELLARRVTLQSDLPASLPLVRGDRVHLQQVLLNLVINGADAVSDCPADRRQLAVRACRTENGMLEIGVSDIGSGIAEEKLPRIFEPFFTTKAGGMGIGLAISKTIVEAHGGRIRAENNAEGGATFRFTLNIAEPGGAQ